MLKEMLSEVEALEWSVYFQKRAEEMSAELPAESMNDGKIRLVREGDYVRMSSGTSFIRKGNKIVMVRR